MTKISTHNIISFTHPKLSKGCSPYQQDKRLFKKKHYTNLLEKKVPLLIEKHVRAEQTDLVQSCFFNGIFNYDDISNGCIYYDLNNNELSGDALVQAKESDDFDLNTYSVDLEIEVWFFVTHWLAYQLQAKGEAILENDYGCWWGLSYCGNLKNHPILQSIAQKN